MTTCPKGQYLDTTTNTCITCPGNRTTKAAGAMGADSCYFCPPGTYPYSPSPQDKDVSKVKCIPCPSNNYQETEIDLKYDNNYWMAYGRRICQSCPESAFSPEGNDKIENCMCPAGFENGGAFLCARCPKGEFSTKENSVASANCNECLRDAISMGQVGNTNASAGSTGCGYCGPGTYVDYDFPNKCNTCRGNTYQDTDIEINDENNAKKGDLCKQCPEGSLSTVGRLNTTINSCYCPDNMIYDSNAKKCFPCSDQSYRTGRQYIGSQGACSPCPVNTARYDMNSTDCNACDSNTYIDSSDPANIKCTPCPSGTYNPVRFLKTDTNGKNLGVSACIQCPGVMNNGKCTCEPGKYYNTTTKSCEPCEAGKYQPVYADISLGDRACQNCPSGKTSIVSGSLSCDYCAPGRTLEGGSCVDCPSGTYQPDAFIVSGTVKTCIPCADGKTTTRGGAVSCDFCPKGTKYEGGKCIDCPVNTQQSDIFNYKETSRPCLACQNGRVTLGPKSSSCSYCPPGTELINGACQVCESNKYQPFKYNFIDESKSCLPCSSDKVSGGKGESCNYCPIGTYYDSGICKPCPSGTYQDTVFSFIDNPITSCLACPSGKKSKLDFSGCEDDTSLTGSPTMSAGGKGISGISIIFSVIGLILVVGGTIYLYNRKKLTSPVPATV